MTLKQNFTTIQHKMEAEDKSEKYRSMIQALEKKCEEVKKANEAIAARYKE